MAINVIITSYEPWRKEIMRVRRLVFVEEQSVPAHLEIDGRDDLCVHALALDGDSPVGTGRIDLRNNGKVGRVAVLPAYRRRGIGTRLMAALVEAARKHGLRSIWFHAQESAIPFYEKLGYAVEGEPFIEAEIPHRAMRKGI